MVNNFPSFYLITPDCNGELKEYLKALEISLINGVKLVQLRSKQLPLEKYRALAKKVLKVVHHHGSQLILNSPKNLLDEIDADGIHLPSSKYMTESERPISKSHILSVACHDVDQLRHAEIIDADIAVLCPIFSTPSSPHGQPMGWKKFSMLTKCVEIPIYALGGLQIEDYEQARKQGAYGIAAKRGLWNLNKPLDFTS